MYTFAEFEKSIERAVCVFLSVVITSGLVLWATAASSMLQDAVSASAAGQQQVVVADVGSSTSKRSHS